MKIVNNTITVVKLQQYYCSLIVHQQYTIIYHLYNGNNIIVYNCTIVTNIIIYSLREEYKIRKFYFVTKKLKFTIQFLKKKIYI